MTIDHATFARLAASMATTVTRWAGEALDAKADLSEPVSDDVLARFILEQRDRLDRMWCYGVQGEPQTPKDGEPGSSMMNPRVSELWPGGYCGMRCRCGAYIHAAKHVTICDPCELASRDALAARLADLDARLGA